ncbi:MAG: glycosyltransferase family 2 protein [Candidatus Omnitrophota bacterium]|jgi:hypothetical protein
MDLSIVIVNWNAEEYLKQCLNSICENSSGLKIEIIVVDNNSSDNSSGMLKSFFPEVKYIANNINVGFGAANNQGIRVCASEYILLLNPDTIVLPGTLLTMIRFMESKVDVGAIGPKILNPDKTIQYECARNAPTPLSEFFVMMTLHKRFPKSRLFGHYLMSYWDHEDEMEVEMLSGACAMMRKQALDRIGMFDEKYFMYAEDTDLFRRIKEGGWKIRYVPSAVIVHYWGKSAAAAPYAMAVEAKKSMERYFKKHCGLFYVILHRIFTLIASLCMVAACLIMYLNIFDRKKTNLRLILIKHLYIMKWSIWI